MEFEDLVEARHSALNFIEGIKIPESDYQAIYNMVKASPSVFNLQPTTFLVINDDTRKNLMFKMNFEQYKIKTSSAVIVVLANTRFEEEAETIYAPMKMLGMMDEYTYNEMLQNIQQFAEMLDVSARVREAEKNAMIAATAWMFAAKNIGWDTCPMHIHNIPTFKEVFGVPAHMEPVLMMTMGKSYEKERKRGFRRPYSSGVRLNKF